MNRRTLLNTLAMTLISSCAFAIDITEGNYQSNSPCTLQTFQQGDQLLIQPSEICNGKNLLRLSRSGDGSFVRNTSDSTGKIIQSMVVTVIDPNRYIITETSFTKALPEVYFESLFTLKSVCQRGE